MFIYFSEHFFDHNFKSCFFWLNLRILIILKQQKFSCNVTKKFYNIVSSSHHTCEILGKRDDRKTNSI